MPGPLVVIAGPVGASAPGVDRTELVRTFTAGVVVRDVVYQVADGTVDKADAATLATGVPLGVVRVLNSPAIGQCIVVMQGDVGGFAGLTVGGQYILASGLPGTVVLITDTGDPNYPDTTPASGEVLSFVGIAGPLGTTLAITTGQGQAQGPF